MPIQKIAADQLFTGTEMLNDQQVLLIDDHGIIEGICPRSEAGDAVVQHTGILCPGFINAHCHLELSHLKDQIPAHSGLVDFLIEVIRMRGSDRISQDNKNSARERAAACLKETGTVAVLDIANTTDTAVLKSNSDLYWYTGVELLGLQPEAVEAPIRQEEVLSAFKKGTAQFTAHAPYSVLPALMEQLNSYTEGKLISVHNQETAAENELFQTGTSDFTRLFQFLGIAGNPLPVTCNSSLRSWLPYFNRQQQVLLVHNTFTSANDLAWAKAHAQQHGMQLYLCLCPQANLYIEQRLPALDVLIASGIPLVIGTDSLASNTQLSIPAELRALRNGFPYLSLPDLLRWATYNGAGMLQQQHTLGSFEKGKQPGVLLLDAQSLDATRLC